MNYAEAQKTEIERMQIEEGLERLRMLDLHPNVIREFFEEGRLNLSELGIIYWLTTDEKHMVNSWEKRTGNKVYHVIKSFHEFGTCYSLLYVSASPEEWELDREDLLNLCPIVYVKNVDDEICSEYGSIGIQLHFGGLLRTA